MVTPRMTRGQRGRRQECWEARLESSGDQATLEGSLRALGPEGQDPKAAGEWGGTHDTLVLGSAGSPPAVPGPDSRGQCCTAMGQKEEGGSWQVGWAW